MYVYIYIIKVMKKNGKGEKAGKEKQTESYLPLQGFFMLKTLSCKCVPSVDAITPLVF